MKNVITIGAIAALSGSAFGTLGSGSLETFADSNVNGDAPEAENTLGSGRTFTVRQSGPVGGTTGIRFMPIEGGAAGSFEGWGLIDFDPTEALDAINADVAATPGATGFAVTNMFFRAQQQFSQPFSPANGTLGLYHSTDDAFNPFGLTGGNYFDNAQLGTLGGSLSAVDDDFNYVSSPGADFDFVEADSDYSAVIADFENGTDSIRMILNAESFGVVAPFKGSSSPFPASGPTRTEAPSFVIEYDIIPAPGAAGLLGFAGLASGRRRRA